MTASIQQTRSPAPPWVEYIYGAIVEPLKTLAEIDKAASKEEITRNVIRSSNVVIASLAVAGLASASPTSNLEWIFGFALTIVEGMLTWVFLTTCLCALSRAFSVSGMRWKKALALTGLPFMPFMLIAPISCFGQVLDSAIILLIAIALLWFLFFEFLAFKVGLKASNTKILALAMTLPPVLFLVYTFWLVASISLLVVTILTFSL
ncbi:MAG: hypothetical protein K8F91_14580 [Candidatus Obscuribacterales bacterium]|nr:hypothetical protein [Candidatus Obscuribacterales bacterium]